jgi:AcrR family transcriptional regulator
MRTKAVIRPVPADPRASVRQRILTTATDLFYREGVRAVGIQRVIDEAGIAKASLYAHYASKDDLVAACVKRRSDAVRSALEARLTMPGLDARAKLLALFDVQVESVESREFRGCPLLNASSEIAEPDHPAKRVIAAQREWLHSLIAELVRDAGVASPEQVAGTLVVLFDGAASSSLVDGNAAAARHARWAAAQILDAHRPPSLRRTGRNDRHRRRSRRADRARVR